MGTAKQNISAREKAEQEGVDVTLLELNLAKTPTERVRDHQCAINLATKLREAGNRYYAKRRTTS